MTRVAINGAPGRMGRNLISVCLDTTGLELVGAFAHGASDALGRDAGTLAGREPVGVPVVDDLSSVACDVVVDFSRPEATMGLLEYCCSEQVAVVIGTTGFSDAQLRQIESCSTEIPVVYAPNMGVGVNLMFDLVSQAARALGGTCDIEIIETHHRHKIDAPSGTALRLGEVAATARGQSLADAGVYARHGQVGPRADGEIGFSTVRGGDVIGEHTVLFAADGERIEITHRASSRQLFAKGAMRAAGWIAGRRPGFYSMQHVLGLE